MASNKRPIYIKKTKAGTVFDIFNVILSVVFFFLFFYPFWNQLILSLNEGTDAVRGGIYWWPREFTWSNYEYVVTVAGFGRSVIVSILRVVIGTVTNLAACGILGYVLAQKSFKGKKFMRLITVLTMYIPMGLIPTYILYNELNLLDTFTVYWLPSLISGWNVLMITSYIENQPDALMESARLDGAGELTIFARIIFPISVPVFAALAVITGVNHWNSWFDVMVYNASGEYDTLQMTLRRLLMKSEIAKDLMDTNVNEAFKMLTTTTIRAATTMVVTIPIAIIYPFFQRYFVGGISLGAVKG